MKKLLLASISLLFVSTVALAQSAPEHYDFGVATIDTTDTSMDVRQVPTGQGFGVAEGKTTIHTGTDELKDMSFEHIDERTNRVTIGDMQADLTQDIANPDKTYITNPKGNEKLSIERKIDAETGTVELIGRDENAGINTHYMKADKATQSLEYHANVNGEHTTMQLKKTGPGEDDVSGRVKASGKDYKMDLEVVNGQPIGSFQQVENGYLFKSRIYADGTMSQEISEQKTGKLLYRLTGTEDYMKIYDAENRLVAEGADEDNMKVYREDDYKEFLKLDE